MALRARELDDDAVEEILEGNGSVPSGYERVADLLGCLRERAPARPDELVVTRMQAIVEQTLAGPTGRSVSLPWRRLVVVGALAAGGLLAVGGLGAAGALPDSVQQPVSDVLGALGIDAPHPSDDSDAPAGDQSGASSDPSIGVTGDDSEGPAVNGAGAAAVPAVPAIPATPADPGEPGGGATPAIPATRATPATPAGNELPPQAGDTPSATAPRQVGTQGQGNGHGGE